MRIDLTPEGTLIYEKKFYRYEVQLLKCLGFVPVTPTAGYQSAYGAPLYKLTREATWESIKWVFPALNDDRNEAEAKRLYAAIKSFYTYYRSVFVSTAKDRLPWADKLLAHQQEVLQYSMGMPIILMAFEQGLGKTLSAISISFLANIDCTLIVAPATPKLNLFKELQKWGVDYRDITIYDSDKNIYASGEEKFVLINYEMIPKVLPALKARNIGHIAIDEAHKIKNTGSMNHKSLFDLVVHQRKQDPNCKLTLMTGTPYKNRIIDFFAYFKYSGHPFGVKKSEFTEMFVETDTPDTKGLAKNIEWFRAVSSNLMIRKTTDECLDLPPVKYSYLDFDKKKIMSAGYNQALVNLRDKQDKLKTFGQKKMAMLSLGKVTSRFKVAHAIALAEKIIAKGEKVVMFSFFTDTINDLKEHFGDSAVIVSGQVSTAAKKMRNVERFLNEDSVMVFIGQTIAAGVSFTLTNSHHLIFLDFAFTWSDMEQCIARVHRIGTVHSPHVYFLFIKNTVDRRFFDLVRSKMDEASMIVDNKESGFEVEIDQILKDELNTIVENAEEKQTIETIEIPEDHIKSLTEREYSEQPS